MKLKADIRREVADRAATIAVDKFEAICRERGFVTNRPTPDSLTEDFIPEDFFDLQEAIGHELYREWA